jgi:shikimate kinase
LDEYTANKYDKDITDIFQEFGEDEFRKIETTSLTECITDNIKTVIALGGGTPCFNNNIDLLNKSGTLVYLKMSADDLYKRLFKETAKLPLVAKKETDELYIYIKELLAKREVFYSQAPISVDGNLYEVDEMKRLVLDTVTP